MDITPLINKNNNIINSYGADQFNINGKVYDQSLIVFPNKIILWNVSKFETIKIEDFIIPDENRGSVEILLIGTGFRHERLSAAFKEEIKELWRKPGKNFQEINIEVMTTGAACRTYNILLAEGRRVATTLIKV